MLFQLSKEKIVINNHLEWQWNKAVVDNFKILMPGIEWRNQEKNT
jgi:hypothetical protein